MKYIIKRAGTLAGKNRLSIWIIFVGCCLYFSACVKDAKLYSNAEGSIYMTQAYSDRGALTVYVIDSPQTYNFGIAYSGFKSAPSDITGTFEVDTSLIAQYNVANAYLGKQYVSLPDAAYSISSLSSVLKAGTTSSIPSTLSIDAKRLQKGVYYLLPIKLSGLSSGTLDTALSVTYFRIDSLYIRTRDITSHGTLTVSNENGGGSDANEGSSRLVDNDYTTKFYTGWVSNMWMMLHLDSAYVLNAYTLTSGNDSPDRDPRDWDFQGSNDGMNWTTLDARTGNQFAKRLTTYTFELNQPDGKSYSYYRLLVHNNNGSGGFQLSEWRLQQYY
ncbi:BT_3987 domain-containing protein [Arachidicoccus sp.]|uniref:BT_3987 domain-containing protein n=1 Tax=Arachidicoccus sp. TaxID=1872624 RepID=UPI003D2595C7